MDYKFSAQSNTPVGDTLTIPNGGSVSPDMDLVNRTCVGLIMPAVFTAAALTIEVSVDRAAWIGVAFDDTGTQCNVVASPVVSCAYQLNAMGMLPYRYIRIRSGTTASPVNQGQATTITVINRPLA